MIREYFTGGNEALIALDMTWPLLTAIRPSTGNSSCTFTVSAPLPPTLRPTAMPLPAEVSAEQPVHAWLCIISKTPYLQRLQIFHAAWALLPCVEQMADHHLQHVC